MSSFPRPPASCADLDLAVVERTLAKHYGDIPAAARELGVSGPDLKRLTWAKPQLLEEADLERMSIIAQVWHVLIAALDSEDWRRKRWASDKIMSSWLARDHPLAPARRRSAAADVSVQSKKTVDYTFRWRTSEDDEREAAEAERLRNQCKLIEHEASAQPSNKD
jgi:hypothetical protein